MANTHDVIRTTNLKLVVKRQMRYGTSRYDTDPETVPLRVHLWLNQKFCLGFQKAC